jgi:uncharacterized protein (DUF1330 family)
MSCKTDQKTNNISGTGGKYMKARDGDFKKMVGNADAEDLVPIHFELFCEEVVTAAAKDLKMEATSRTFTCLAFNHSLPTQTSSQYN